MSGGFKLNPHGTNNLKWWCSSCKVVARGIVVVVVRSERIFIFKLLLQQRGEYNGFVGTGFVVVVAV